MEKFRYAYLAIEQTGLLEKLAFGDFGCCSLVAAVRK